MSEIESCLGQLSPLLDDIVARIDSYGLSSFEQAALITLAISRISVGTRISIAQASDGGRALTPDEREELMVLLMISMRQIDASLLATIERQGGMVE